MKSRTRNKKVQYILDETELKKILGLSMELAEKKIVLDNLISNCKEVLKEFNKYRDDGR